MPAWTAPDTPASVGTGSGNAIPSHGFEHLSIGTVERGVFGGTCLNRGCIPSKMFVYPADVAVAAQVDGVGRRGGGGARHRLVGSNLKSLVDDHCLLSLCQGLSGAG